MNLMIIIIIILLPLSRISEMSLKIGLGVMTW